MDILISALVTFLALFVLVPFALAVTRILGLYAIVEERTCRVYVLFGRVVKILDEPGLHILPFGVGPSMFLVNLLGQCNVLDLRLDQEYRRSEPVNSEEGAPMGIGIWYEMWISDPVSYLFKNTDPRGSLRANVSSATVRCLSNMPLSEMLETRHNMSLAVRNEVSAQSQAWGYQLGSVYIRKVHFRDAGMIKQIEEKVVNRLRQVTSAIRQAGANQVSVIASSAERAASIEFAKASAIRPAGDAGAGAAGDRAGARGGKRAVRDPGDAEAAGERGALDAAGRWSAQPRADGFAGGREPGRRGAPKVNVATDEHRFQSAFLRRVRPKPNMKVRFFGVALLKAKELTDLEPIL